MESVRPILNNKIHIQVIFKKNQKWYLHSDVSSWVIIDEDTVNELLNRYEQLVFINLNTIINIDYVNGINYIDIAKECILINGQMHIISKRYMPLLKHVLKEKYPNLFSSIQLHTKESYLRRVNSKRKVHTQHIKYLLRKGSRTIIFYDDGTSDYFYETLKYFYEYVLEHNDFIKVKRDCIVNIRFINNCKIDTKTKTGEILVDSEVISISRRNLQVFKRFMQNQMHKKDNTFTFAPRID